MNVSVTRQDIGKVSVDHRGQIGSPPQPQTSPTLDSIVRAVCFDAKYDSLKFVLRSDTGHDGE